MMKFIALLTTLAVATVQAQRTPGRPPRSAVVIPNRFIVELEESKSIAKRADDGETDLKKLYEDIAKLDVDAKPAVNYTSDVFVGTSITLANGTDVNKLLKLPEIKKIYPVYSLTLEPLKGKSAIQPPEEYNIHLQTGVQKLHDKGIYGQDVIIAIVDSGVDYYHPALGGGFGPGFKIESGWDFKGDHFGTGDLPDDDPFEDCDGHGTHVTGIIAGNSTKFLGVAPQARIRVYKTMNCYRPALTSDILIAAHIRAYQDGADIISTSIGDTAGWPNNPWPVASSRIAKKGVFVISSAGNSGEDGPFISSSEAAGEEVISVGASHASQLPAIQAIVRDSAGEETKIAYLATNGVAFNEVFPGWGSPYVRTGMKLWSPASPENTDPQNKDGCTSENIPWEGSEELTDRVVLVRRSANCTARRLYLAAAVRNSRYVLIINDEKSAPFIPSLTLEDPVVEAGIITEEVGIELERRLKNNETLWIRFPDETPLYGVPNLPVAGTVDIYSSWGLASDLSVKPDIVAPGSDIFSTFPSSIIPQGYLIASGTSMATPYISGVVALYLSAHGGGRSKNNGKREFRDIAQSLVNRANPVHWADANGKVDLSAFAPVAQQGGGLVDAYKFVQSQVLFSPSKIALNHTGNFQGQAKITVTNTGSKTITFNITHQPGVSFYTYLEDHLSIETEYPDTIFKDKVAETKISTQVLQLTPGNKKTVQIDFTPPSGFVEARVPVYGGHIAFSGSDGNDFFVPYSGLAIDGKKIYEPTSQGAVFWLGSTLENIVAPTTVDLKSDGIRGDMDLHFPIREATVELVLNSTYTAPAAFKFPRIPGKDGFVGVVAEKFGLGRTTAYTPPERFFPGGTFVNGTSIPNGTYRYVLRAWKPFFEDRNDVNSWSYTVSPPITIIN